MRRRSLLKSVATMALGSVIGLQKELNASVGSIPGNGFILNEPSHLIKHFGDKRDWFFNKRYGMFIHWGIYSIPAWHEQYQQRAKIARSDYIKLAKQWNPKDFNPKKWLDLMEEAGMEYITITAKHHDGFCLWDTKYTDFNTMNTPYKRDIIGMLSEECHKRKVPLCLYYSVVDWNHPNYPNQGRHHELPIQTTDSPSWEKYMEFLKSQVKELCTNYGEIHGFWWDMNVPEYYDPSINDMIRKLQPGAVINNRGFDEGDFGTPERDFEENEKEKFNRPVEACQSVGMESWGFRVDEDYYTDRHLIRSIDRYLANGANYLLNVGPTAEGVIPKESADILRRIGEWYKSVKESFEETSSIKIPGISNMFFTVNDNILYIHVNPELNGNGIKLNPIDVTPQNVVLLNSNSKIKYELSELPSDHKKKKPYLRLFDIPANGLCNTIPVMKLEFDISVNNFLEKLSQETE